MIESFADLEAEKIFKGIVSRKLPLTIQKTARRKLVYLDDADDLRDLFAPPGNRLEALMETVRVNTVSVSTTNIESVSNGKRARRET